MKKEKALQIDKAIFCMKRKIKQLQNEIYQKITKFLINKFNIIIIFPFEVSNMMNRKTQKKTRKTIRKMLC